VMSLLAYAYTNLRSSLDCSHVLQVLLFLLLEAVPGLLVVQPPP